MRWQPGSRLISNRFFQLRARRVLGGWTKIGRFDVSVPAGMNSGHCRDSRAGRRLAKPRRACAAGAATAAARMTVRL
jgi:hypothetical protein